MAKQVKAKGGGAGKGSVGKTKEPLPEKDEKAILDLFNSLDKDGNKFISRAELRTGLRVWYLDPTEKDIDTIYTDMGLVKDAKITYDIFRSAMAGFLLRSKDKGIDAKKAELTNCFKLFDKDNSNSLDKGELRNSLKALGDKMTDEEIDKMFALADTNKDGKIGINEFVNILCKK